VKYSPPSDCKFSVYPTNEFQKDYKRILKRKYDIALLDEVIVKLAQDETLEPKYKDHALTGDMKGFRECHILSDWLLIYISTEKDLVLVLTRTGTHSDLFSK